MDRSWNKKFQDLKNIEVLLSFQFGESFEIQEKRVKIFKVFDFRVGSCQQAIREVMIFTVGGRPLKMAELSYFSRL